MTDPTAIERYRIPDLLRKPVEEALDAALQAGWPARIWGRDTSVWTADPEVAARIANRLGWLDAPQHFGGHMDELAVFAATTGASGIRQALVCGMGGSSLAPEVLAGAYPMGEEGIPVGVLDSTDPEAVRRATEAFEPSTTLYLIASKSGTTTETLAFLEHFWALERAGHHEIGSRDEGEHFAAIGDPGPALEAVPHSDEFRAVFLNPPDIGGRYSALSYVGLVPGALLDLDLEALLADGRRMAEACRAEDAGNPGLALGTALGALALEGRDKLTFVIEPGIAGFGAWAEQLVAESTGKNGWGIVPVDGEPLGAPGDYGPDRIFVRLSREAAAGWRAETDVTLDGLAAAGHPVIDLVIPEGEGLGGEFFRWEFATAVAGAVIGVDPFDEPNVTESKENTRRVLAGYREFGRLPAEEGLSVRAPLAARLGAHLALAPENGYVAVQAYVARTPERDARLAALRERLRSRTGLATTVGYGPRLLHSTGQLHKGGPPTGCFLQLVADHPADVPIPGAAESFGMLIDAQALGDLASLRAHGRPVLRVGLGADPDAGLDALIAAL
ncbi:MAG: transaldolase, transaldolase / glucose-6-phosphate isomerase [Chloroflexi bacterium CSP1-4]|nr:MAG: transaldolase, transaldolase / glucose-6-phosphate isomerase [Chloroflexi bacterium CSP1-4]